MSSGLQIDPNNQGWETELDDIGEDINAADIGILYNNSASKWVRFAWSRVASFIGAASWDGDITDIDETSSADIGEALADDDQFIVYNTSGLAWVRSALSRLKAFMSVMPNDMTFDGPYHPIIDPGSDTDAVLLEVAVTGVPQFKWNETLNRFEVSYANARLGVVSSSADATLIIHTDDTGDALVSFYTPSAIKWSFGVDQSESDQFVISTGSGLSSSVMMSINRSTGRATFFSGLTMGSSLFIGEQATADADVAGLGQVWVKNDTPNVLWFTDDAGNDRQVSGVDYSVVSGNDSNTDVTGAELEELTDGSETTKHSHSVVLADSTLGSPAANFDLTSISGAYKLLRLWYWLRSDRTGNATDQVRLMVNNDSGTNYEWTIFYYLYSAVYGTVVVASDTSFSVSFATTADDPSGYFASGWIDFFNYTDTTNKKYIQARGGLLADVSTTYPRVYDASGVWSGTPAAISRLTLSPLVGSNWAAGSRLMLVGIK